MIVLTVFWSFRFEGLTEEILFYLCVFLTIYISVWNGRGPVSLCMSKRKLACIVRFLLCKHGANCAKIWLAKNGPQNVLKDVRVQNLLTYRFRLSYAGLH